MYFMKNNVFHITKQKKVMKRTAFTFLQISLMYGLMKHNWILLTALCSIC